jgi:CheY-like chemotaxis protein
MRLKILRRPTGAIDGITLEYFHVGAVYEVGPEVASVFLVEGWAELVTEDDAAVFGRPPPPRATHIEGSVLVVDDEPDVRRLTESLLTAHGYHVMLAAHGRDAIRRLREQCPDLIVLDLSMPVMDGWQFRTEQCDLPDRKLAAVPVLLMTGADGAATHADALRAVGVVQKPFDPDDLLDAVSTAIGSQKAPPDNIRPRRSWKRKTGGRRTGHRE